MTGSSDIPSEPENAGCALCQAKASFPVFIEMGGKIHEVMPAGGDVEAVRRSVPRDTLLAGVLSMEMHHTGWL